MMMMMKGHKHSLSFHTRVNQNGLSETQMGVMLGPMASKAH